MRFLVICWLILEVFSLGLVHASCSPDDEVKPYASYSDREVLEEGYQGYQYGGDLQLWRCGEAILGILTYVVEDSIDYVPSGFLEEVIYDPVSGKFSFVAQMDQVNRGEGNEYPQIWAFVGKMNERTLSGDFTNREDSHGRPNWHANLTKISKMAEPKTVFKNYESWKRHFDQFVRGDAQQATAPDASRR